MRNWKRITLVIIILIGGTMSFGYWSIDQFSNAFDDLSDSYLANTYSTYLSFKQNAEFTSTSPDISEEVATSTNTELATTSPETSGSITASADPELSFTFPQSNSQIYIGCTYPISWQSPTAINSLETDLIDGGTRKPMGPITSGLAKENTIEKDSQNLEWKVGSLWPGPYYIKVSKINGVEAEFRSRTFQISGLPEGISEEEKNNICRKSNG